MSGYEQRLAADKAEIRALVDGVGKSVREAIAASVEALLSGDTDTCYAIIIGDLSINRQIRRIDKKCHAFVARHLPSAGHLRFVSSVLRMDVALERVGDYAASIARTAVRLSSPPPPTMTVDIRGLNERACKLLGRALLAFASGDAELATATKLKSKKLERTYAHLREDLVTTAKDISIPDALVLVMVMHRLQRVVDQTKNVCEETLFELTGQSKPPKQFEILFLDDDSSKLAPLAAALATKAFPQSGTFSYGAIAAAKALDPGLVAAAERLGIDTAKLAPTQLELTRTQLERFQIIVNLADSDPIKLADVPYATIRLNWSKNIRADEKEKTTSDYEATAQALISKIRELMVLLHGDDAD